MKLTKEDLDILNSNLNPHDIGYVKAVLNELDFINKILNSRFSGNKGFTIAHLKIRRNIIERYLSNILAVAKDRN